MASDVAYTLLKCMLLSSNFNIIITDKEVTMEFLIKAFHHVYGCVAMTILTVPTELNHHISRHSFFEFFLKYLKYQPLDILTNAINAKFKNAKTRIDLHCSSKIANFPMVKCSWF